MESLLTKKEIASRYNVSASCIDKWMKRRKLPFIRLSRRCVRFDATACDEALFRRLR